MVANLQTNIIEGILQLERLGGHTGVNLLVVLIWGIRPPLHTHKGLFWPKASKSACVWFLFCAKCVVFFVALWTN